MASAGVLEAEPTHLLERPPLPYDFGVRVLMSNIQQAGPPQDVSECPVALAVKEALADYLYPDDVVTVIQSQDPELVEARVFSDMGTALYHLYYLRNLVDDFDNGQPIEPQFGMAHFVRCAPRER